MSNTQVVSTQVHTNKVENKRLYDKHHICIYCGTCVIKMSQHFFNSQRNESEVEKIAYMPKNSEERKLALNKLTLKGDFLHNVAVLSSQSGCLFVLRRSDANNPTDYSQYIPCIYCLGYVTADQAYRHANKCKYKRSEFATTKTKRLT